VALVIGALAAHRATHLPPLQKISATTGAAAAASGVPGETDIGMPRILTVMTPLANGL